MTARGETIGAGESAPLEKLERLGCLYLTFLNNPGGLSFQEIRSFLPLAYPGDPDSARRKFERDKEELKGLGLPLRHFAPGQTLPGGAEAMGHTYVPVEEIQKLPELRLTSEEASELAAVLFAAIDEYSNKDENMAEALQSAAIKLLYRHPAAQAVQESVPLRPGLPEDEGDAVADRLGVIMDALHRHRVLRLGYPARGGAAGEEVQERLVEGRGLLTHRGRWCLVAYCRRVRAVRSFYLDRITLVESTAEQFRPDPKFQIKEYSLHPLALRLYPVEELRLAVDPEREEILRDFLTGLPEFLRRSFKDDLVTLETTNRDGLFSWMIRNPGVIRALGPAAARERFRAYLAAMGEPYRRLPEASE